MPSNYRIIFISFIIFLNAWRFIGLEISPPGFYLDEAAGATQIICLKETWKDFYGNSAGLFTAGFPGFGLYTPIYVYGEMVWTTALGNSIWAFRSFLALVTTLTVYFLYLWTRNLSSEKTALYVALAASISPWAYQFSRIAWDPPLAVLFLVIALYISSIKKFQWLFGVFLALAAYSYPPMRMTAVLIGVLIPGVSLKTKIKAGLIFIILCTPIILELKNPEFMARSNATAIWGTNPNNPYLDNSIFELILVAFRNFLSFFSLDFLFLSGDKNLRHSIQEFGMLSWLDGVAYLLGIFLLIRGSLHAKEAYQKFKPLQSIFIIALIGIATSILPSALTHDGNPNSLRAIGAWPFFCALTGICITVISQVAQQRKLTKPLVIGGIIFFATYLTSYFNTYPKLAQDWFATEHKKITFSYLRMSQEKLSCADARNEPEPRAPVANPPTPAFNSPINFGDGGSGKYYLNDYWYEQEGWGVWSSHQTAKVIFPLEDNQVKAVTIDLKAFLPQNHSTQKIEILVNGNTKGIFTLTNPDKNMVEITTSQSDIKSRFLELKFRIFTPLSPKELGINPDDPRKIGIGLREITLNAD
jgi:hypothetical protein